jgi:hypothetical protein
MNGVRFLTTDSDLTSIVVYSTTRDFVDLQSEPREPNPPKTRRLYLGIVGVLIKTLVNESDSPIQSKGAFSINHLPAQGTPTRSATDTGQHLNECKFLV